MITHRYFWDSIWPGRGRNLQRKIYQTILERQPLAGADLGCGASGPRNDFGLETLIGIDLEPSADGRILGCDLSKDPIPLASESQDLLTAYDFLEHIPRWERHEDLPRYPFVELMNEVHRVLRPNGLFFSQTPAFPAPEAFRDPTHVNIISEDTFELYFCGSRWAGGYGFRGQFRLLMQGWNGPHLLTLLVREDL